MEFTYKAYKEMVKLAISNGYELTNYHNWTQIKQPLILRHDIDYDIDKAVQLAEFEYREGITSTYFVLVTSDFYNVFSKRNSDKLKKILEFGHELGVHFDEMNYSEITSVELLIPQIEMEAKILENVVGKPIMVVSMHRPSKRFLESNLHIPGMINSYSNTFFSEFKYLSDSRRRWREPVLDIVKGRQYDRLHILTHAFWYNSEEESIDKTIRKFINKADVERYEVLYDNITDLESIMQINEIGDREDEKSSIVR